MRYSDRSLSAAVIEARYQLFQSKGGPDKNCNKSNWCAIGKYRKCRDTLTNAAANSENSPRAHDSSA